MAKEGFQQMKKLPKAPFDDAGGRPEML